MADELIFKGNVRCTWVRANNGIIQATFEPEPNHPLIEYMTLNLHRDHGIPTRGKLYLFDIQPAFPHDAERSG